MTVREKLEHERELRGTALQLARAQRDALAVVNGEQAHRIKRLRESCRPYARGSSSDCCNGPEDLCGKCSRCKLLKALAETEDVQP